MLNYCYICNIALGWLPFKADKMEPKKITEFEWPRIELIRIEWNGAVGMLTYFLIFYPNIPMINFL